VGAIREVVKKLGLLLLSLGVVLLLAEVGLRVLGRYRPPDPPKPARPDLYVPDERVGYHLWPSTRTCLRYPSRGGRVLELNSNSDGFRSSRELGETRTLGRGSCSPATPSSRAAASRRAIA
jgi:hypothetical protein